MRLIARIGISALAFGLGVCVSVLILSSCEDGSGRTTARERGGASGTSGVDSSNGGSSCGGWGAVECGGPGLPLRNPYGCWPDAGVSCVQLANASLSPLDAGPNDAVFGGCLPEEDCYGDSFRCGASTECTGVERCCIELAGGRFRARCKDGCFGAEVQLCEADAECVGGSTCSEYRCSHTALRVVKACGKPASCD